MASHAQKHFIKLCLKGERLPAKVAESGTGYTLSGKALDPDSAAAKAYGFKSGTLERAIHLQCRVCQCCWKTMGWVGHVSRIYVMALLS